MNTTKTSAENVLIIGAYGLIGHGISMRLRADGCHVVGLGRDLQTAKRLLPGIPWLQHDLRDLCDEQSWLALLDNISAVVNCSGALQDGPDDDLEVIHHHAISALAMACKAKDVPLIQISAVGAKTDATTRFLASKGRGDAAIRASGGKWIIFRPGLVLARNAYGGATMLRMLAAFPWVQPIATPNAKIQTISLDDVAEAVASAVNGAVPYGVEADLVEPAPHTLRELVARMREWLGFRPARFEVIFPTAGVALVATFADALSRFGWRSPLRSTSVKVLAEGIYGTPADLSAFGLAPAASMAQTLNGFPAGSQDRLFARMALLFPVIMICLSLFWLMSGIIGFVRVKEAAQVLQDVGWSSMVATTAVLFWAVVDIAIGVAFAVRKYAKLACWAAIGVSGFYLLASTLVVPSLWINPLGPLIKVVPAIVLALVARATLDAR